MGSVENIITENLPIWSSAVQSKSSAGRGTSSKQKLYGVKKLRELILDLAVRGLLVPQDPNDEPASILIEKIAVEKEQLLTQGQVTKQKPSLPLVLEEIAFDLPVGWRWVRMQDIAIYIQRGKSPKYSDKGKVAVISQKCVQWLGFDLLPAKYISDNSLSTYKDERFLQSGDLIWNSTGTGTVGRIITMPKVKKNSLVGDSHVTIIRAIMSNQDFIKSYVSCPLIQRRIDPAHENAIVSGSTKQVELNTSTVISIPIPLPPLEEQHRIVAKVDELMALCDTLEQQQEDSIQAHETLVEALLEALTSAADADAFQAAWQRISVHFDVLFTTEHSIGKLKEAILQLAVMGKLVPQDPNDEPASVLLDKVAAEKEWLAKCGKVNPTKDNVAISSDQPFGIPKSWKWDQLIKVAIIKGGNAYKSPRFIKHSNFQVIRLGNIRPDKLRLDSNPVFISQGDAENSEGSLILSGEILLTMTGTKNKRDYLYTVLVNKEKMGTKKLYLNQRLVALKVMGVSSAYMNIALKEVRLLDRMFEKSTGTANQANIGIRQIETWELPFPPLSEQHRIVAKVAELMALCNQLIESLQQAQQTQIHLTDAVVENAL